MIFGKIDYREAHPPTKGDFGRLAGLVRQLVGEPVLFGALSYPRELTVHFGAPREFKGPKSTTLVEGSSVLGAVCSMWRIKSAPQGRAVVDYASPVDPRQVATTLISEEEAERFLEHIGGTTVRDVEVFLTNVGYGLRIGLSDGSLIELFPTPDDFVREVKADDEFPIPPPDWELFTPYGRYLRVGPGSQWAYLPSDKPEAKQLKQ